MCFDFERCLLIISIFIMFYIIVLVIFERCVSFVFDLVFFCVLYFFLVFYMYG